MEFLTVLLAAYAVFFAIFACFYFWDVIAVFLIKYFQIVVFPTAITIAAHIEQSPADWTVDNHEIVNPKLLMKIWTSNKARSLHVETSKGKWEPNTIERRIIWEAAYKRRTSFIKKNIVQAITIDRQQKAVKDNSKITDVV